MKRAALVILLVLACSPPASADEPPSWQDFKVKSANGKFTAEVKARAGQENKNYNEREFELSVYESAGRRGRKLWSAAYRHDGYPGGVLSDDGSAFVHVNFWYYGNAPVVSIYHAGQDVKLIRGEEFEINPAEIRKTVSHELWLSDEPGAAELSGPDSRPLILRVRTIDKRLHRIDVEAGRILK